MQTWPLACGPIRMAHLRGYFCTIEYLAVELISLYASGLIDALVITQWGYRGFLYDYPMHVKVIATDGRETRNACEITSV